MCDGMGIGAGRREQAQRLQAQREAEAEAGVLYDEIQRQVRCFMFDGMEALACWKDEQAKLKLYARHGCLLPAFPDAYSRSKVHAGTTCTA